MSAGSIVESICGTRPEGHAMPGLGRGRKSRWLPQAKRDIPLVLSHGRKASLRDSLGVQISERIEGAKISFLFKIVALSSSFLPKSPQSL